MTSSHTGTARLPTCFKYADHRTGEAMKPTSCAAYVDPKASWKRGVEYVLRRHQVVNPRVGQANKDVVEVLEARGLHPNDVPLETLVKNVSMYSDLRLLCP